MVAQAHMALLLSSIKFIAVANPRDIYEVQVDISKLANLQNLMDNNVE
jgi:hypothetical protein